MPQHHFYDRPPGGYDEELDPHYTNGLEQFFGEYAQHAAAFIIEPVVQGAGGMHFYSPEYLPIFRRLCDQHGLLLIYDEIATGFGRTGELFLSHHPKARPDIVCIGKALTGGYMTLAATITTLEVAETISKGEAGCTYARPHLHG